jgi:hypothetical protein
MATSVAAGVLMFFGAAMVGLALRSGSAFRRRRRLQLLSPEYERLMQDRPRGCKRATRPALSVAAARQGTCDGLRSSPGPQPVRRLLS